MNCSAISSALNSGRIVLPRNDRLQGQIVGLERRTSAVGRDTISHPERGHDDVANAVAGAAALSNFGGYDTSLRWVFGDDDQRPPPTPGWKLAGFRSKEAAEAYKAGARAQYGRTVSFPWDG